MYEKHSLLANISNSNFTFIKGDVRNEVELKALVESHDILIPLAALVGFPLCEKNPIDAELINFKHVANMVKWKTKEQIIIYPCTNSGYGSTDGKTVCTEETEMKPISVYGTTKINAELAVREVENYVTFRLATVFGVSPRMRTDLLVNNLVLKAFKEKNIVLYESSFMRNYVHVDDVARGFLHVIDNFDKVKDNVYNLGNDSINMNKRQLCEKIAEHTALHIIESKIGTDLDKRNYIVSSDKFYSTGFECKYDLDYGISELLKAYNLLDEPWLSNY